MTWGGFVRVRPGAFNKENDLMATALDVFVKANGPLTVTQEEMDEAIARGVRQAQEVNAINDAKRADLGWGQSSRS